MLLESAVQVKSNIFTRDVGGRLNATLITFTDGHKIRIQQQIQRRL